MDIIQAKQAVIDAGIRLVEAGLIARTWGNVSCRVDDETFVITPSGRDYLGLTLDDIVPVKIADCSYEGEIKPSSEKKVHAVIYRLRPEAAFVIHTHQVKASGISFMGYDINGLPEESRAIIGPDVPVASYGLPGTKTLCRGVEEAFKRSSSKAAIMSYHGAVCYGSDADDAFAVISELEKVCDEYVKAKFEAVVGRTAESFDEIGEYLAECAKRNDATAQEFSACTSERDGNNMIISDENGEQTVISLRTGKPLDGSLDKPLSTELHRRVYNKRDDINNIIHSKNPQIMSVSKIDTTIVPFLDDFAQLIGVTAKTGEFSPSAPEKTAKKVERKLRHRNAVLLKDNGGLCAAGDKSDAEAVEMVLAKNSRAYLTSLLDENATPIKSYEALLMRIVYKAKYSKKKNG